MKNWIDTCPEDNDFGGYVRANSIVGFKIFTDRRFNGFRVVAYTTNSEIPFVIDMYDTLEEAQKSLVKLLEWLED